MWGQALLTLPVSMPYRIIPTRVGTRLKSDFTETRNSNHPHACGDKAFQSCNLCYPSGSSPRVWGQVRFKASSTKTAGIIPTRVGTSFVGNATASLFKDHPHACGDKSHSIRLTGREAGSSPRVWGQDGDNYSDPMLPGIIPTRVGTSSL